MLLLLLLLSSIALWLNITDEVHVLNIFQIFVSHPSSLLLSTIQTFHQTRKFKYLLCGYIKGVEKRGGGSTPSYLRILSIPTHEIKANPNTTLMLTQHGGHIGFFNGGLTWFLLGGPVWWLLFGRKEWAGYSSLGPQRWFPRPVIKFLIKAVLEQQQLEQQQHHKIINHPMGDLIHDHQQQHSFSSHPIPLTTTITTPTSSSSSPPSFEQTLSSTDSSISSPKSVLSQLSVVKWINRQIQRVRSPHERRYKTLAVVLTIVFAAAFKRVAFWKRLLLRRKAM